MRSPTRDLEALRIVCGGHGGVTFGAGTVRDLLGFIAELRENGGKLKQYDDTYVWPKPFGADGA